VFVADLTCELRAWPQDTWAKIGVDPDQAAQAVISCWRDGEATGLQVDDLSFEEAQSLTRPAMTYVRGQLRGRLTARLARATGAGYTPPAAANPATCFRNTRTAEGRRMATCPRVSGTGGMADATAEVSAAGPRRFRTAAGLANAGRTPTIPTPLVQGLGLRKSRSRAPPPAAHRTSCHVRARGRRALAAGHLSGPQTAADTSLATCRTPSIRTAVVPEAADGQSAARSPR
jgi:hypothetical protein